MRVFSAKLLRRHWHALLIIPPVVIVMTWPTFARIFDADEFWLHAAIDSDAMLKLWDAWHLGRTLAEQSDYFYTDAMFHPRGMSLAFHGSSTPHTILLLALQQLIPADDAYNLLYLLMLCFNAFSVYLLIQHLLKDKWIALFGALIVGVNPWFTSDAINPDIIMIGTLPLTIYFLHRSFMEGKRRLAAIAGICAGVTTFIGIYMLLFLVMTTGIFTLYHAWSKWRQPSFWLRLLLLLGICASISIFRFYPMIADAAVLSEGLEKHIHRQQSRDVLEFLILSPNPFIGNFLHSLFSVAPDSSYMWAYLGYINLFFIASAVLFAPNRRSLTPWLLALFVFLTLRMGDYLTVNGEAHTNIRLPEHFLGNLFPFIFRQIGNPKYYQTALATPLAVLACYGLSTLLGKMPSKKRLTVVVLSTFILAVEFYQPERGSVLERQKTAYIEWLRSENQSPIKIIDLPQSRGLSVFYLLPQTLGGYPTAFGWASRMVGSTRRYVNRNYLLRTWRNHQPAICLPLRNSREYLNALDELLQEGFSHIVLHQWRPFDADLSPSFANLQPAYDNGYVRVYRLGDLRQNCAPPPLPTAINRFTHATWVLPGNGSAIISYHPSDSIDPDTLVYLRLLFSDWDNFHHLYRHNGDWKMQSAKQSDAVGDDSAETRRIVFHIFNADAGPPTLPASIEFRNAFNLCRREASEEGSVIELWLNPRFSCALVESSNSPHVEYDNGALLQNMLHEFTQDIFDLQILWRNLPDKTHSLSVQVFNDGGDKVHGQDFVIGSRSITRHSVDVSSLPPGDYIVKLVFYRYSTGQSVPGTFDSSSRGSFERALTIATIHKT